MWQLVVVSLFVTVSASPTTVEQSRYSLAVLNGITASIGQKFKEKCMEHNSLESFDKIVEAIDICSYDFTEGMLQDVGRAISNRKEIDQSQVLCRLRPRILSCFVNIVKAVEPCTDPAQRGQLKTTINATNAVLEYTCDNDGERLKLLFKELEKNCLRSLQEEIQLCVMIAELEFNQYFINMDSEEGISSLVAPSDVNQHWCKVVNRLKQCHVVVLKRCLNSNAIDVIDGLYSVITKEYSCQKYVQN